MELLRQAIRTVLREGRPRDEWSIRQAIEDNQDLFTDQSWTDQQFADDFGFKASSVARARQKLGIPVKRQQPKEEIPFSPAYDFDPDTTVLPAAKPQRTFSDDLHFFLDDPTDLGDHDTTSLDDLHKSLYDTGDKRGELFHLIRRKTSGEEIEDPDQYVDDLDPPKPKKRKKH